MNRKQLQETILSIFERAKAKDEFEYACTLLRVRGAESAGWDTLEETDQLYGDLFGLSTSPLKDLTKVRLALFLYSHLTEVDPIYLILVNLMRVIRGDRYTMDPFGHLYLPKKKPRMNQRPPSAKSVVDDLKKTARAEGEDGLADLLEWFFNDSIRNAFFHSDYTLHRDEFRSREAWFKQKDGTYSQSLKIDEVLDIVNRGAAFYQVFMGCFVRSIRSYKSDKLITGRMGPGGSFVPVTLVADKGGLRGFKA